MLSNSLPFETVLAHLSNSQFALAIDQMKLWKNQRLAEFLFNHSKLHKLLQLPDFNEFWEERRYELHISTDPFFSFKPQPGVPDCDLVAGYLLYLLEQKITHPEFLTDDFLSFHLIRHRLHGYTVKIADLKSGFELKLGQLDKYLYNLEGFAKQQGCPGYLLLAYGYLQAALFNQQLSKVTCEESFKYCWKYLHLAALSEKDSEAAIHNAYFGKGLVLSNPFELDTIPRLKEYYRELAGNFLTPKGQSAMEQSALITYQQINTLLSMNEGKPC